MSKTRPLCLVSVLAMAAFGALPAAAQWVDGGVPVNIAPGGKFGVVEAQDGFGGAFLAWTAIRRDDPGNYDVLAQHVRADGSLDARWPSDGLPICTSPGFQSVSGIVPDGTGGAFVAWSDFRDPPPDSARIYAVYVQRIEADGIVAPGWPENGLAVCPGGCTELTPKLALDGEGGAFVAWPRDTLIPPDYLGPGGYFASRVTGAGTLAPGWPSQGIPIASLSTRRSLRSILSDDSGGLYVIGDGDLGNVYCQRIDRNGEPAAGWPADGFQISSPDAFGASAMPDGAGGLFLFWSTLSGGPNVGIFATRLRPDGSTAPGWPSTALRVSSIGANEPLASVATSDSGSIVLWVNFVTGIVSTHALKVTSNGTVPSGWPQDGITMSSGEKFLQSLVGGSDGMGGAYTAWEFYDSAPLGVPPKTGVIAQHVTSTGVPGVGWPVDGISVSSAFQSQEPAMIPASGNAAIIAWESYFGGDWNEVLAQKLTRSGVESFGIFLVGVHTAPNEVRLTWRASPASDVSVTIYRREEAGPWVAKAVMNPDPSGSLTFDDSSVAAGHEYSYRLTIRTGGQEHSYGETSVQVPLFTLGVRLASPNPVRRDLVVDVELPSSTPAWIELLDVQGRVVDREPLDGSSGPGVFRVSMTPGNRVASGIYFFRVTQSGKTAVRRAALIR